MSPHVAWRRASGARQTIHILVFVAFDVTRQLLLTTWSGGFWLHPVCRNVQNRW